jgi:hypothetical protein
MSEQINLSGYYIEAAAWNTRLCKELEDEGINSYRWYEIPESLHNKHEYTAISSFFASVQFLEAEFNKVLEDGLDLLTNNLKLDLQTQAAKNVYKLLVSEARKTLEKGSQPHEKFHKYLKTGDFPLWDTNKPPYADVDLLVNLRNAYTHYKPKWNITLQNDLTKLEVDDKKLEKLRNRKDLAPNPLVTNPLLTGINTKFFPRKVACYTYAKWAVESSLALVEEFYKIIGFPFRYAGGGFDLSTTPKQNWKKLSES